MRRIRLECYTMYYRMFSKCVSYNYYSYVPDVLLPNFHYLALVVCMQCLLQLSQKMFALWPEMRSIIEVSFRLWYQELYL